MDMQEMFKEPFWYWRRCNRGDKMKERITSTKERPMLFSTEMVKAILDLKKTQTRRVITKNNSVIGERGDWNKLCWDGSDIHDTQFDGRKTAPLPFVDGHANEYQPYEQQYLHVPYNWKEDETIYRVYPRWQVGDRLWVKETWYDDYACKRMEKPCEPDSYIYYRADGEEHKQFEALEEGFKWKPSIFMPRWASRILLEITNIRAERVQDISDKDVQEEGCKYPQWQGSFTSWKGAYKALWDSINAMRGYSWESNPWVWVIEFKVIR